MCPSIFMVQPTNMSVELDPAVVTTTRLLAQGSLETSAGHRILAPSADTDKSQLDQVGFEQRRSLQVSVIDTTTAATGTGNSGASANTIQVYFLKLRNSYQDQLTYSQVQSVVIQDSFYSLLGDKLKDYPRVLLKTPLISLQFFSQGIDTVSKIYNRADPSKIQVTELSIKLEGYLYCMILADAKGAQKEAKRVNLTSIQADSEYTTGYSSMVNDDNIMGLHVKYGIYLNNSAAVWKTNYTVDDPNWILYFNIDDLPMVGNGPTYYSFYYYATDKRVEELAGSTKVYRIDFKIKKAETKSWAGLIHGTNFAIALCLLVALGGLY